MAVDKNSKDQAMQLYLIKITQKNSQNQCQNSSNKQSFACHKAVGGKIKCNHRKIK